MRKLYAFAATSALVIALALAEGQTARGAVFTVTNTFDSGPGSLRQAIADANAVPGLDTVAFAIPGIGTHTIALFSPLQVDDPVIIDATTEPGYAGAPVVELVGAAFPGNGIEITSGGSTIRGLAIGGFDTAIAIQGGASGNVIAGDYIGTDASGAIARGNRTGVFIDSNSGNRIGGTSAADRNVISANGTGVLTRSHTINNVVQGNYIGTDSSGTLPLGNYNGIVFLSGFNTNVVRGNILASSTNDGIELNGSAGNIIQGNYIGTNAAGGLGLGNANNGIFVNFACCNNIGGDDAAARNIISGNGGDGILISHPFLGTTVRGNWIGLSPSGAAMGNAHYGIDIHATNPFALAGQGDHIVANVVSANGLAGGSAIRVTDGANLTVIRRNLIGTDPSGTGAAGNYGDGIVISDAPHTAVGGEDAGNSIAFNAGTGVSVLAGDTNTISANRIYSNGSLGIDLAPAGVTPNDRRDGDVGANGLQNFPDLKSAVSSGASGTIHGILDSVPSSSFRVEIFGSPSCDPSGYGEGQSFLGAVDVATNNAGIAPFAIGVSFAPGDFLTATATDANGNTSEFSGCLLATAAD